MRQHLSVCWNVPKETSQNSSLNKIQSWIPITQNVQILVKIGHHTRKQEHLKLNDKRQLQLKAQQGLEMFFLPVGLGIWTAAH